jgi:hypothetical protein
MIPVPYTPNINATIIGFWRQGATVSEMIGATGLYHKVIERIIKDYRKTVDPYPAGGN